MKNNRFYKISNVSTYRFLLICILLTCSYYKLNAQTIDSVFDFRTSSGAAYGPTIEAVTSDDSGNIYIAGYMDDSLWVRDNYSIKGSNANHVLYLTSFDKGGNERFSKIFYTRLRSKVILKSADSGKIFLSALFRGPGSMLLDYKNVKDEINSGSGDQVFILQMNNLGHNLWHVYTQGLTSGSTIENWNFRLAEYNSIYWMITCAGDIRVFASPYKNLSRRGDLSNLGNKTGLGMVTIAMRTDMYSYLSPIYPYVNVGGSSAYYSEGDIILKDSQIVLTGTLRGTFDFDPSAGKTEISGSSKAVYCSYDTSMQFKWAKKSSLNKLTHLVIDANNKVRAFGDYSGSNAFSLQISSIDLQGNIGNEYSERFTSGLMDMNQLIADRGGNVFLTGSFRGSGDFDPTGGRKSAYSSSHAPFLVKYNENDSCLWQIQGTGSSTFRNKGRAISLSKNNDLYWAGTYTRSFRFSGNNHIQLPFTTAQSGYLAYLKECRNFSPSIEPLDTLICKGEKVHVKIKGSSNIQWSDTNSALLLRAVSPDISSIFYGEVNDGNGCFSSLKSKINIQPLPKPLITLNNSEVDLSGNWETIVWYLNGAKVNGQSSGKFKPTQNGDVFCIVSDSLGCEGKSNTVNRTVSIKDLDKSKRNFKIATVNGEIQVKNLSEDMVKLFVFDEMGRVLKESQIPLGANCVLPNMPAGIYVLLIQSNNGNKWVVKQFLGK